MPHDVNDPYCIRHCISLLGHVLLSVRGGGMLSLDELMMTYDTSPCYDNMSNYSYRALLLTYSIILNSAVLQHPASEACAMLMI